MSELELKKILDGHAKWIRGHGERANLRGANLRAAKLDGADLFGADLRGSDLFGADLRGSDLRAAKLFGANLFGADLRAAKLDGADLRAANLFGADLPHFKICPEEGDFIAWKMTTKGVVKLLITGERTSSLIGRKCRCSEATVLEGFEGAFDKRTKTIEYKTGAIVKPNSWNNDIRIECAHGIHFFITKEEAEEWVK